MAQYIKTEEGYKGLEESISTVTDNKMDKTNPTGTGSFSMNRKAGTVVGTNSHTEGFNTTASQSYSHAEGSSTQASGLSSHSEGYQTTASGQNSHAEGNQTTASGSSSHAEGSHTTASGGSSHAEGNNTIASGDYSHAQGKLNIEDTSSIYADIIGNGTIVNGTMIKRSNAATVDWNGNAWFAGDIYTGSTSGTNKDDGSKKLATEEYVDNSIATNSVLYTAQSLTEEQKEQARKNIGAQDLYNGLTPVSYSCTDGTYSVSDTVYLESGNITSPVDTVSNDVRLAFSNINFWGIPTQLEYWKNDIKKYKLLIDNGYLENNTIWYSKPDKKFKKQIRFGTNSRLGNYIIFNFNYDYEVIGQLVYYVDTDTISTGTDTYLNRILKRDKNDILSYSAIKLASDPTEPMQIATKQYVDNSIAASGADISLGLTSASVGQIIKVKAVDEDGKPTEWEASEMDEDFELINEITVAEDVGSLTISVDKNGNPFELKEAAVLSWTVPFAESINDIGRAQGFSSDSRWGYHTFPMTGTLPAGQKGLIGRYDLIHVKVVNGYIMQMGRWLSQNSSNVRGILQMSTAASDAPFNFEIKDDEGTPTLRNPQGNITCYKIISYSNPAIAAGSIIRLYGKRA